MKKMNKRNKARITSKEATRQTKRRLLLESLEDRRLLAGSPELISLATNAGDHVYPLEQPLDYPPTELVFRFNAAAEIDPSTLDGISVVSSGPDKLFAIANVQSTLGTSGVDEVTVQFRSQIAGDAGNDIKLVVSKSDHGNDGAPTVSIDDDDNHTIVVDLNTNALNPSTVGDLIDAINEHDDASKLVIAELTGGNTGTDLADVTIDYSPLHMDPTDDRTMIAGHVGLNESARDIVFRFSDSLDQGKYRVVIPGAGPLALRDLDGTPFNQSSDSTDPSGDGDDLSIEFEVELGARVLAVVPQPVVFNSGLREQLRDTVFVYFNNDDLNTETATDTDFYQLVYTNDTIENTDDIVINPASVDYSLENDLAQLTFSDDLDRLVPGGGTFRLRVGDSAPLPLPPLVVSDLSIDAGDQFSQGLDIGQSIQVVTDGAGVDDGDEFGIELSDGSSLYFEFDRGWEMTISGTGPLLGETFEISNDSGATNTVFEFISDTGSVSDPANVAVEIDSSVTPTPQLIRDAIQVAVVGSGLVADVGDMGDDTVHFGWESNVVVTEGATNISIIGVPGVDSATAIPIQYRSDFTQRQIADAIATAIDSVENAEVQADVNEQTYTAGNAVATTSYRVSLSGAKQVYLSDLRITAGGAALADEAVITVTQSAGVPRSYEIDLGNILEIPDASTLEGKVLSITHPDANEDPVLSEFEFDTNGNVVSGRTAILITGSESANDLAATIKLHVEGVVGDIVVTHLGGNQVHFGNNEGTSFDGTDSSFVISSEAGTVGPNSKPINILPMHSKTSDEIASEIGAALASGNYVSTLHTFNSSLSLGSTWTVSLNSEATAFADVQQEFESHSFESIKLTAAIGGDVDAVDYPGANHTPGHRDVPFLSHLIEVKDSDSEVAVFTYSFPEEYGTDENGNILINAINDAQKQRVREVFDLYAYYLGVEFVEQASEQIDNSVGIKVAVGDMVALKDDPSDTDPTDGVDQTANDTQNKPGSTESIAYRQAAGIGSIILDYQDFQDPATERFGESFFREVMYRVGYILGLGHTDELAPMQIQGDEDLLEALTGPERIFPGSQDIRHGQILYRPDGNDIDVYRVTLDSTGTLDVEILAERLADPSTLNAVISVYRDDELIGRNDAYFSDDPRLQIEGLEPGQYTIAVSSKGNTAFDLNIDGTGRGGTTSGTYELNVRFTEERSTSITDRAGTRLDGDLDGLAGGTHDTWHKIVSEDASLKLTGDPSELVDGDWIRITDNSGTASAFVVDTTGSNTQSNIISVTDGMTEAELIAEIESTVGSVDGITTSISTSGDVTVISIGGVRKVEIDTQADVLEYLGRNIYVAKDGSDSADGSFSNPYSKLSDVTSISQSGDVIRVLASAGDDGDFSTLEDNPAYQIGFSELNGKVLEDGADFEVPKGVVVVVDGGSIFKMRRSRIGVGSSSPLIDRSEAALQVLGTPYLVSRSVDGEGAVSILPLRNSDGEAADGTVYFTSIYDDIGADSDAYSNHKSAAPLDWGGIDFRRDVDGERDDRIVPARRGLFLDVVNYAELRYGGGSVIVDGVAQVIDSVSMKSARPQITNSTITLGANGAFAATPDSFKEDTFLDPTSQEVVFTPNYDRIGPWIRNNEITNNTLNGILLRVDTPAAGDLLRVTQSTRWDDIELVHIVPENLQLEGNVGGLQSDSIVPPVSLVTVQSQLGGEIPAGSYAYKITFVDALGNETLASDAVLQLAVLEASNHSVQLDGLPAAPEGFIARRIYRSESLDLSQWGTTGYVPSYQLVGEVNQTVEQFVDDGSFAGGMLDDTQSLANIARLHGSLVVDPGVVVKLNGSRIDALFGSHLIAEGTTEQPIVFTSVADDRFGGSGSFDTLNDEDASLALAGQWGGVFVGPTSLVSIDHSRIAFGGGTTREIGTFATFNAIELHQGELRLTNSVLESNATGVPNAATGDGSQANDLRGDFSTNEIGVIFVRGAQPIIVNNIIRDNWSGSQQLGVTAEDIPAINIDVNSLNADYVSDSGRRTVANFPGGANARRFDVPVVIDGLTDNQGPWIDGNVLENNDINGMVIRGGTVTAAGVWDDTGITHVLTEEILVPDTHITGGLRLESSAYESLVVKAFGDDARIRAIGRPLDITDRIGGMVHIVGQPRHPVIITSALDCTEGAGYLTDGSLQVHLDNSGACEADAAAPIGNSGAVVVDGGDRDDHGFALDGPDDTAGTTDDENQDGWLYIEQLMLFAHAGSRNDAPNDVLAIGIDPAGASQAFDAITSASIVNGHSLDFVFGAQISTVNFNDYKVLYIPSSEANVGGGIADADSLLLATRKDEVREFINNGGSHVALTQATVTNPYAWLELPDQFVITDWGAGGIMGDLRKTQAAIDAGITISDADLSWGTPYHNDFVGPPGFNGLVPFVMDDGVDGISENADDRVIALGLGSGSFGLGVTPGGPGDWDGIYLDQFSHDTNVLLSTEQERSEEHLIGELNDDITGAQRLGQLARNEYASDENGRLGFTLLGSINASNDQDVFGFRGETGVEVWFDIDNTDPTLDTKLEILNAAGQVIAEVDNSHDGLGLLPTAANPNGHVPANHVNTLDKSSHDIVDYYSSNPMDAGLRVVLPGTPSSVNQYYVRVSSQGGTTGHYQLELRIREQDFVAGSTIQYADIRFGVNAVTVSGQPIHSPLVGETVEADASENDETIANAQPLGNLLNTDRATLSIAGSVAGSADVDWYEFNVEFDSLYEPVKAYYDEDPEAIKFASITIDLDYANGLGGPDTAISLFRELPDGAFELVAIGEDSNIADDQAAPLSGNNLDDLSRGSAGVKDGFIGPLALSEGRYFLAVYPESVISEEQLQTLSAVVANPDARLEPLPHFDGVVDRITDPVSIGERSTGVLFDADSVQPLHLGDVPLFITQGWGPRANANPVRVINGIVDRQDPAADQTNVWVVDPLTGLSERRIEDDGSFTLGELEIPCGTLTTQAEGSRADTLGSFRDVATRQDGSLFGYTVTDTNFVGGPVVTPQTVEGGWSDEQAGDYHQFDLSTCTSTFLGEDNIETHEPEGFGATDSVESNAGDGHGIQFEALTYGWPVGGGVTTPTGLAVGNRPAFTWVQDAEGNWERQLEVNEGNVPHYQDNAGSDQELDLINLLYRFDVQSGDVISAAPGDRGTGAGLNEGAGTNKREIMQLVTDVALDPQATRAEMVLFDDATNVIIDNVTGIGAADWEVHDGDLVPIDLNNDGLADLAFQFNSGPDVRVTQSPSDDQYVVDGDRFFIDGQAFEINTGATLVVNASNGMAVERGYFDITEDDRYEDPQTYRFHLRHTVHVGRLPGSDITGANTHNIDIVIPFSDSITSEEIAGIITFNIQNAFQDGNNNSIRDNGEREFRVRAVQHPGENSKHRIILEFDTGDVNVSPAYERTGRSFDDVASSSLDSCVSQTLCVHGDSSLKDQNAGSAGDDYNSEAVVEIKYVGGPQVTEFDDGEADDFWGHVEENTTRDNLIEAIKTATNGGTADWMRVGVGTVNTITVFSDVAIPGGDPNQPKSADSAGDRLNFTNFTYATDTDGYPYSTAPSQDGFDEFLDRGVFSLDFNGDGFVDSSEVMRDGVVDTSFSYLSAKETELRNRRPNNPAVPLGISSLSSTEIFEVDFGSDWTGIDLAQGVSDALMARAGDATSKIAQDEVTSDVTGAVVQIYDVLNESGINFGWDVHNDLNLDGIVDSGEIEGHAKIMVTDDPHNLGGPAPGGLITGLAWIYETQTELDLGVDANFDGDIDNSFVSYQPRLFAVSDSETDTSPSGGARSVGGGLFEITDPLGTIPGVPTALEYIPTAFNLRGINFQGLVAGPAHVEDGKYAETLFAIDADGVVYAFDTAGNFQSVFASGQNSVDTGLKNANGLAFGNLDYNLWHFTDTRGTDTGHGVNASSLTNQAAQDGGTSLYFGFEDLLVNDVLDSSNAADAARLVFDNPNILDNAGRGAGVGNYDFAGGASGSLTTKPFSLDDYSNGDAVHLFFNYWLETEDASGDLDSSAAAGYMADSFRAYISVEDGQWQLLSTNNAFECDEDANPNTCTNRDDEFDMGVEVRETFDTADWRQAMVDLSSYVGNGNVRLRFDFATGGAMSTGDVNLDSVGQPIYPVGGQEIILKPGYELTDGDTVTIDGETVEFDLGYTLSIPAGSSLQAGDGFTVTYKIGYDDASTTIDDRISITESFLFEETTPGWSLEVNRAGTGEVIIPFASGQTAKEVTATAESIMKLALEALILPATGSNTIEGGLLAENNGMIADAVVTPLVGGNFNYHATGEIGDVPDEISTPGDDSLMDVDLIQMEPHAGDVIDVKVTVNVPSTGDYLQPALRFFDESGAVLNVDVDSAIVPAGGVGTAELEVTARVIAPKTGKMYLGISSIGNESYDAVGGGGTTLPIDPDTGLPREVGQYDLQIETQDPDWPVIRYANNHLQLVLADEITLLGPTDSKLSASGLSGATQSGSGNSLVDIRVNMSAEEVAESFKRAYASLFANGQNDVVKGGTNSIFVIGHEVTDAGDFSVNGLLPGEAADNFYNNNGAANNQFEGVYIDDVFIAPTERGMIVTGGANQTGFVANPIADADLITTGTYQVEIRRSFEYGEITESDLNGDGLDETYYAAFSEYHTNDRFVEQRSLVFPDGASLYNGLTFTISDGVSEVTFEFADVALGGDVQAGNQAVLYSVDSTDGEVALAFANAMNSDAVQSVLDIKAAGRDFGGAIRVDNTSSNVINLFGNALFFADGSVEDGLEPAVFAAEPVIDGAMLAEFITADDMAVSNVTLTSGANSAGTFSSGHDVIGIAKGIVLSTGDVTQIGQPNTDTELSGDASGVPSATIDSVMGVNSADSTTLTFDFVAQGSSLYMNAVFASEEYPSTLPYAASDKVVVVIDDLTTSGTTVDFSVVEPSVGVHVSSSEVHNGDLFGIDPKNAHLYNDNSIEHNGPALNDFYSDGNTKREVFAFDGFTSVMRMEANGLTAGNSYRMTISIADVENAQLDSAIFIEANSVGSVITFGEDRDSVIGGIHWEGYGDPNLERLQGQIIIDSNTFTSNEEFGLNVQAGTRTDARVPLAGDLPHPGAARNLGAGNPEQLAPGVVVTNNIFANNEAGQLRISGEDTTGVTSTGIVPFARVVNNTIVGGTDGSARPGIVVENNASPTILNNIIAFTTTGISVDGTSDTTIVGGNAYADNTADVNGIVQGDFAINVNSGDPLFTNLSAGNFYPAGSSRVVDASLNSLQDRLSLETLRESVGIAPSPIIASDVDRFGQLRVDDPQVAPPVGLGFNVVKDRGAVERADYTGPSAYLIMPHDNDRNGVDLNQDENNVKLNDIPLSEFRIQLVDNVVPITTQFGSMIDDSTVAANAVEVYQYEGLNQVIVEACCGDLTQFNNRKLELGRDYSFNYDATNDVISIKSLAGSFEQNNYYRITIRSGDGTVLEIPAGIDLPDGTTFDITDEDSQTATFEYDSGYVLQMPQASTLVLPDSDDLDSLDRTTFEIAGALSSVIFEFDTDGTVFDTNQAITYGVNATATEIANTAATVMNAADLGLHAKVVALDDDQIGIHVGANRDHAVTLGNSSPLTEVGIAGAIDHHDSLIVDDGTEAIEFYFDFTTAADRDTDFVPADTVTEAVSILVRHDMTHVELAQALSIAISNKDLGLSPTSNADGLTHVGGEFNHRIDLANAPNITVDGAPGLLNTPLSIRVLGHGDVVLAEDGETFQVANSVLGSTVLFEFDDDGSINDSTAVAVNFTDTSSVSDLVTEIVTEINNANLELEAFESSNSVVGFVDSSAAAVTVGTAVGAIDLFGTAGLDPAVAISYSPFENNEQIAEATADAINSVSGTILDGVMATRDVDSVTINGAQSIVSSDMDILNVVSRTGVKDHAGNALLPNSEIDKAEFIIETGVELDYGDAPHSYATNKESGGPTHVVVEGFSLGENVTVEANANVDDGDDGVVFSEVLESGFTSAITVTLNNSAQLQNAVLDAWIDFDRDEVFGEHERVLTARVLDSGEQDIDISVPAGTLPGRTYARLRLSTTGGLLPTGPAFSGEVEDYQITIGGNPWMNPFEPLDVNRDGHITPIDSLLVINKLNDLASGDDGRLPVPVPEDFKPEDVGYLDVNDNGYVDPLDALRVINKLNEIFAESEDAAEGEFSNLEDVIAAISYDVEEARDNDESDHDNFFSGL